MKNFVLVYFSVFNKKSKYLFLNEMSGGFLQLSYCQQMLFTDQNQS